MKQIRNKRAEGYIDVAVAVLVISFLLVLLVSVFGILTQKQDLKYMCSELVESATINGKVGDEVQARYEELCKETGLTPDVTFDAVYFDEATGKVQFGDRISCTLTMNTTLPGFGGKLFPMKLTVTVSGLSQIYWK